MTLITDQSTAHKGVKINLHSSSLIKTSVKSPFSYKYQPSSGLSSSLLMKTSCLRLKLVELNFFASFNADNQRKTYVSNVSKGGSSPQFKMHSLANNCPSSHNHWFVKLKNLHFMLSTFSLHQPWWTELVTVIMKPKIKPLQHNPMHNYMKFWDLNVMVSVGVLICYFGSTKNNFLTRKTGLFAYLTAYNYSYHYNTHFKLGGLCSCH